MSLTAGVVIKNAALWIVNQLDVLYFATKCLFFLEMRGDSVSLEKLAGPCELSVGPYPVN